nr:hypothetical protein [Microbacterium bovistercoris]
MIKLYAKAIVYIALAAAAFLVTALSDNRIDTSELINLGIVLVGAVGVYLTPNLPSGWRAYLKGIVAFLAAALVALLSFLAGGVTLAEWMQVGIAALAGIGVVIVPNEPTDLTVTAVVSNTHRVSPDELTN